MMKREIKNIKTTADSKNEFGTFIRGLLMNNIFLSFALTVALLLLNALGSWATILTLYPSGSSTGDNVTYSGGTAATALDSNDSDTSYGSSSGTANYYYLELDNHTTETGAINSVTIKTRARRDAASGSSTFTIGVKTNGSSYFSSGQTSSSSTYALFTGSTYNTNPQTGAAWTWSEIDSLVAIIDHTNSTAMRATQLYAEVDYTPPVQTNWGRTAANGTNTNVNFVRVMGGTSPNVDGMKLKSVSVYVGNSHSSQVRVAVYQGGDLSSGPDGATLLCDAGATSGSGTNQFLTLTCPAGPLILKNAPLWVAVKGNDSGFAVQYSSSSANAGDFQTANGRFQSGGQVSTDESVAFPATWPSDSGTFSNYWYSYYLTYETGATCTDPDPSTITIPAGQIAKGDPYNASTMFSKTGDVESIEYMISTPGTATTYNWGKTNVGVSSTKANFARVMSGNAPSSSNMHLKSVSIYVGANHGDQVRLAVYTGGSLTAGPSGATLLYDFGTTSGSATNQWLTITYTGPDITIPSGQPVWIAYKSNGGGTGFDVRYSSSASGSDFQTGRGRWNSVSVSTDDTVAYPATWPADSGSFSNYWYSAYIEYHVGGSDVCIDWTSNSTIPASINGGSKCGNYTDGVTYTLDVRGTDPDCGNIITTTARDFTWRACYANTTDDLSYSFLESYEVTLMWSFECTNNEYYKIYRNGSFLADVIPCRGTYTDTTVSPDTDYTYTVRGYSTNEPCESADSNQLNIHTPVYEPRTAPGIAAASPADQSIYVTARYTEDSDKDNTLLIEWGYDQVDFSLGSAVVTHSMSPFMYQITGLTNGKAYHVRVTYQDSDGYTGSNSNVQEIHHVVPAVWSDDSMLHNGLRFPGNKYWGGTWGTPSGEYGGFTCATCHAINTSNIKRIKESVTAPAGGFPGAEVVFSQTGAGGFGDDTIVHTTSQKICEVCHTKTLYHRFNSPTARLHESEPAMYDCTLCHPHEVGFRPDGACTICHAIAMGDRVAVMGQFNSSSHHVQGVAVNETHCYQCHWEANADGSVNTTYHGGSLSPGSAVDLVIYGFGTRPASYSVGVTAVRYTTDGSRTQILEMNQHCISCHNNENNSTQPFGDGNTPNEYAWDGTCSNPTYDKKREDCLANGGTWTKGTSINARYTPETSTQWGKYSGANTNGKAAMTKAHSSHGVAYINQQGYDLNDTWPDTSGNTNVACFDCHNSHGSDVEGTTTSYTSDATKGGNLKSTIAGKGGYAMTYKPAAGGSTGNKNQYNAGAALCFDCHETVEAGTTPWGYQGTYGASQPIRGYLDTPYFGLGTPGPQQRYTYKAGAGTNKGGHLSASSALNTTPSKTINGLCTPCHDPHGVSPTLNQDYAVPMLKGTWMTSPYREDAAPSTTNDSRGGGRRAARQYIGSRPGYNIDQNTFTADTMNGKYNDIVKWDYNAAAKITETINDFAGLCLNCHPKSQIDPDSNNTWKTYDRIHDTVKGWAQSTGGNANNTRHAFTCSKCHSPHNSALPRMMVTNCLNDNHRGRVASGGNGTQYSRVADKGAGAGRFPAGGGGFTEKDESFVWNQNTGGAYFFGNVGTSKSTPPAYRTCHDSQPGNSWTEQKWNNVTQW
ncbi:MAG: hypothetical protein C4538_12085 [Nitrospiraceae bacterium]|nr:MAG: hypothetical protein C4538_12085 [Nitrospiraceae bacterium]